MKKEGKTERAVKRAARLISVMAATLAAGISFIQMTNCMELNHIFWESLAIFALSVEYLILYMYENGELIDEMVMDAFYLDLEDDGDD